MVTEFAGKGFAEFKTRLADLAVSVLGPIGLEMQRLTADPGYVDSVLREGGEKANAIAAPIVDQVHDIVGFLR